MSSPEPQLSDLRQENQPNRGEDSNPDGKNEGSLDHIFDVLKPYEHPFVLVGAVAHRWMGCAGCADEGFDMVIRNHQLKSIAADMVKTGHWELFDSQKERAKLYNAPDYVASLSPGGGWPERLLEYRCEADAVLNSVDFDGGFEYLRLWSDEIYRIDVDQSPLIEVPTLYAWNPVLIEEEHHPAIRREDGWWYGPDTRSRAEGRHLLFFPHLLPPARGPTNSSPILIPGIPTYLDALVYHKTQYEELKRELYIIAEWQIRNLTRYLYLELPHQKNAMLFQVEAETENSLQPYFERYKRKPTCHLTAEKKVILVKQWDPESFPEHVKGMSYQC